jgi:glutathione S-transferase
MADQRPILYNFRRCPFAMRARMALAVSGVAVELREVVLREKPAEMLIASPKGTVPVLVLGNRVIDQSLDVMRWALTQNDPENWLEGANQSLIQMIDGPFKTALDRYKYPNRHGIDDRALPRDDGMTSLAKLNAQLVETAWLSGGTRGLADIAIFPFVRQFAATDPDWFAAQDMASLQAWLDALDKSALFVAVMDKYPQWKAGDPPTLFQKYQLFGH